MSMLFYNEFLNIKFDSWSKTKANTFFFFSNVKELTKDQCGYNGWFLATKFKIIVKQFNFKLVINYTNCFHICGCCLPCGTE